VLALYHGSLYKFTKDLSKSVFYFSTIIHWFGSNCI